jgi:hypothetical protein
MEPAAGKELEFSEDESSKPAALPDGVSASAVPVSSAAAGVVPTSAGSVKVPAVIDTADAPSARRQSIDKLLRSPTGALSALVIGAPSAANAGDIEQVDTVSFSAIE